MVHNLQWNRPFTLFRHGSKIIYFHLFLLELFPFNAGKKVQFHSKFNENLPNVHNILMLYQHVYFLFAIKLFCEFLSISNIYSF
jgi:hypothetical protein